MAKKPKSPGIKPIGKPDSKNTRRQSQPKTPGEQKQAIADDIESAIYSYQPVLAMESAIRINDVQIALGIGGPNLKLFIDQLETNYKDVVGGRSNQSKVEKESSPELKQISRDTTIDSDRKGAKPNTRKPNPPSSKPSTRRGK
jgi:hypothetical protein